MKLYAWVMDLNDPDAVPEVAENEYGDWFLTCDRELQPSEVFVVAKIEGPPAYDARAFSAARAKMMDDRLTARLDDQRSAVLVLLNRAANHGRLQAQDVPGMAFENNPAFWTSVGIAHMVVAGETSPWLAARAWKEMQAPEPADAA